MSPEIDKLAEALSAAQGEIRGASKDAQNPHFKSKYADLDSIWSACRDAISKHGLAVVQIPICDGERVSVRTVLMHKSGQWIAGELALRPLKDDPQAVGSAITYGRRYGLSSMVGIAPVDDDGEGAMGRQPQPRREPEPPPQTTNDPELMQLWANMRDKASCLAAVEGFRTLLGEEEYLRILAHGGVESADQLTTISRAKGAVKALLLAYRATQEKAA